MSKVIIIQVSFITCVTYIRCTVKNTIPSIQIQDISNYSPLNSEQHTTQAMNTNDFEGALKILISPNGVAQDETEACKSFMYNPLIPKQCPTVPETCCYELPSARHQHTYRQIISFARNNRINITDP